MGFFGSVINLEREDGEPVDDQAGSLGVQRRGFVLGAGQLKQGEINLLDEIVAQLVQAVDGMLYVRDGGVRRIGRTGFIFLVPKVEVGMMLAHDKADEIAATAFRRVDMPLGGGGILQVNDLGCAKHDPRQTLSVSASEF